MESDGRPVLSDAQRTTVRSAAYISDRGILVVTPTMYAIIGIAQSNEKAASIGDAEQRAIQTLTDNVLEATRAVEWPATKQVYLCCHDGRALLGAEFSIPPLHVTPEPVSVIGIAESAEGWKITLEGQYKALVTLSPDFQPLKAERVGPPKP
jgi:hypothetical protein